MKLKNAFLLLASTAILFSCQKEEETVVIDTSADLTTNAIQFDESNYGVYEGTFTTLDSENRGVVVVSLKGDNNGRASLKLSNGNDVKLAVNEAYAEGTDTNVTFSGQNMSFRFTVNADGSNPTVSEAIYNGQNSIIKTLKETTKAPVVPIPGTYLALEAGTHPTLGTGVAKTFNLVYAGDGSADDTMVSTILLGANDFGSMTNTQSNCGGLGNITCDINGTSAVGPLSITWTGTHTFTPANCSQVAGTWSFPGTVYGVLSGEFISDAQCLPPVNDECAGAIDVLCGGVETATTSAATTTGQPTVWPDTADPAGPGIWYTYTSTGAEQNVTVDTCGSNYDTKLFVYSDTLECGTADVGLVGNDDSCGLQSSVTFNEGTTVGTVFYIYAAGFNGATGSFILNVTCVPLPPATCDDGILNQGETFIDCGGPCPISPVAGDTMCNPIAFTPLAAGTACVGNETLFNSANEFSDSGFDSSCFTGNVGKDAFYSWTATETSLVFNGEAGGPGVVVRNAADASEVAGACFTTNTDGTLTGWAIGDNLVFQVYDFVGADVEVGFCLAFPAPPIMNDTAATAIAITPDAEGTCAGGTPSSFTFSGATNDATVDSSCATEVVDAFFTWTSTTDGLFFASGTNTPAMAVYDATGTTEYGCIPGFGAGNMSGWTVGDVLLIQLSDGTAESSVTYCLEAVTIPAATPVACGADTFVDPGGNPGTYDPGTGSGGGFGGSVEYLVDAGAGNVVNLAFSVYGLETNWDYLRFYDGTDASATVIGTSDLGAVETSANGGTGFTGTVLAGDSMTSSGQFMFVVFSADTWGNGDEGWVASANCNPAPPVAPTNGTPVLTTKKLTQKDVNDRLRKAGLLVDESVINSEKMVIKDKIKK